MRLNPRRQARSTRRCILKKVLALSALLPLALLFGAAFQMSVPDQLKAIQSGISDLQAQVASLAKGPRKFYLTRTEHDGAHALSACAAGYHMVAVEILDPRTCATTGSWVRPTLIRASAHPISSSAGFASSSIPPLTNCSVWTNASGTELGNAVSLHGYFDSNPVTQISPWFAFTFECNSEHRVWCAGLRRREGCPTCSLSGLIRLLNQKLAPSLLQSRRNSDGRLLS
jgi:hypothetical protein